MDGVDNHGIETERLAVKQQLLVDFGLCCMPSSVSGCDCFGGPLGSIYLKCIVYEGLEVHKYSRESHLQ